MCTVVGNAKGKIVLFSLHDLFRRRKDKCYAYVSEKGHRKKGESENKTNRSIFGFVFTNTTLQMFCG